MKTIIDEAANSFEMNHNDRCINEECNHKDLIKRIREYEMLNRRNVANEVAVRLGEVRDDWLIVEDIKKGSFAEFVELIFNTAIGFCNEIK